MFKSSAARRCVVRIRLQSKLTPNPNSMSFCQPFYALDNSNDNMTKATVTSSSNPADMAIPRMSSSLQILEEADENLFERDFLARKIKGITLEDGTATTSISLGGSPLQNIRELGTRFREHTNAARRKNEETERLLRLKERAVASVTDSPSSMCELFVPEGYTVDVAHHGMADAHPISRLLFRDYPREISSVFIAPQYVTVTKLRQVEWEPTLNWSINSLLSRYASSSMRPVLPDGDFLSAQDDLEVDEEKDSEVMQCVKELLKEQVRPMIMADGGDLRLVNLNEVTGVLSLKLLGACRSCPSSENTLKNGIERVLQHFLPEIKKVVEVKGNPVVAGGTKNGIDLDNASLFEPVHMTEKSAFQEVAKLDRQRRAALKGRTASGRYTDFDSLSEPDGDDDE